MSRSTEQKKKVDNFADSSFLCDSGDENNTMLKQFNKRFFDAEHPRKLESLSKYLMMKFLTVNKSAILQYELCNLENYPTKDALTLNILSIVQIFRMAYQMA